MAITSQYTVRHQVASKLIQSCGTGKWQGFRPLTAVMQQVADALLVGAMYDGCCGSQANISTTMTLRMVMLMRVSACMQDRWVPSHMVQAMAGYKAMLEGMVGHYM